MNRSKTLIEIKRTHDPSDPSIACTSPTRPSKPASSVDSSRANKKSPRRAQTSKTSLEANPNINIYSIYANENHQQPQQTLTQAQSEPALNTTTSNSNPASSPRSLERGYSQINLAVSHGFLLRYQPAIICATKPKSLCGPIDIYDVNTIRDTLKKNYKNEAYRKKTHELNRQFYKDLEFDDYFSKKSNWLTDSKFINTHSFHSAVKCYLPVINARHLNNLSAKYVELKKNRRDLAENRKN